MKKMSQDSQIPDVTTFDQYLDATEATASYPRIRIIINDGNPIDAPWLYPLLGLVGETGELAEKFKKLVRNDEGLFGVSLKREDVMKESGDVLWYLARMAKATGYSFSDVAKNNVKKLFSRMARGVIIGQGDNR